MKILHRYLVWPFVKTFLFSLALFIFMFVIADCLNNLDDFIRNRAGGSSLIAYYAAMIPIVLVQIIPAASLLALTANLSQMNRHSEITAMKASGLSATRIVRPVLVIGIILSFAVMAVEEWILQRAWIESESIKTELLDQPKNPLEASVLRNLTLLTDSHQSVYAREFDKQSRILYDVIVMEEYPDMTIKSKTTADRAVFENGEWFLYRVRQTKVDNQGHVIDKPVLTDRKRLHIRETPEDFLKQGLDTQFMKFSQLRQFISKGRKAGYETPRRFEVDLWKKIASPFTTLLVLWVGFPLALRLRRGSMLASMTGALGVLVCVYALSAVAGALGKGGQLSPWLAAWLPHACFGLWGWYWIKKTA